MEALNRRRHIHLTLLDGVGCDARVARRYVNPSQGSLVEHGLIRSPLLIMLRHHLLLGLDQPFGPLSLQLTETLTCFQWARRLLDLVAKCFVSLDAHGCGKVTVIGVDNLWAVSTQRTIIALLGRQKCADLFRDETIFARGRRRRRHIVQQGIVLTI